VRIIGLDHVQLAMPVGAEDQARRFYVGLLGFREEAKPPALAGRGGCWFSANGVKLHLGVQPDFVPARKAHPAFFVTDLSQLVGVLERAGIDFEVDGSPSGIHRIHLHDPFGNRIEFIQDGQGFSQQVEA
jgi:catechol 2,3-dioxygenase-like lactoylglutathione lyase family enzyme